MGNTGKPSRACDVCKKRKIKCDLATPACKNCRISGWKCPGPLSIEDVTFRKPKVSRYSTSPSPPGPRLTPSRTPSRTRELSMSLEGRATAFFFRQYTLSVQVHPNTGEKRGVYDFLPLLVQEERKPGLLQTVISACGLAALANAGNVAEWQTQAYGMLTKAIGQLKVNLQDPEERVSDQTLAAIMLMGTFETIVSGDIESMRSHSKHVMAAAHCIEWRGPTQFRNEAAVKLFAQLRPIIIMTCHQLQESIPYALKRWSRWAEQGQREEEISSNDLAELHEQLLTIRAQLKHCQSYDVSELTAELLRIDAMVENWKDSLPSSWAYNSHRAFPEKINEPVPNFMAWNDEYPDLWIASIWNNYRVVRLVIHETLVTVLNKHYGPPSPSSVNAHDHILYYSSNVLGAMGEGICRSVSYHLGPTTHGMRQLTRLGYPDAAPTPGGSLILWPLFLSGLLRTTLYEQRMWITSRLREIGLNMGLRLAISMANTLEQSSVGSLSDSVTWLIGEFSF